MALKDVEHGNVHGRRVTGSQVGRIEMRVKCV